MSGKAATPEAKVRAAVLIQKWFRRHAARLELKRRTSWIIYQNMENSSESSNMRLHSFFSDLMTLTADKKGAKMAVASKSPTLSFSERLRVYGEREDKELLLNAEFRDIDIEKGYSGPNLTFPLNANHVHQLVDKFRAGEQLHAKYLLQLLHEARLALKTKPNINQVSTSISKQVTVVGDLHGDLTDLLTIFDKNGLPDIKNPYVFNGDFIDRGPNGVEVIVLLLSCLMVWPTAVFLNRGNHEDSVVRSRYKFNDELLKKYRRHYNRLDAMFDDLFSWLPLAAIIDDRIFVAHGGVSEKLDLDVVRKLERSQFDSPVNLFSVRKKSCDPHALDAIVQLLWNDPKNEKGCDKNDTRGIGYLFGPDSTAKFLKRYGFSMVVRSHECKAEGYEFCHSRTVLTVFSASDYDGLNKGAYVKFDSKGEPTFVQYLASETSFRSMGRRITSVGESALQALRVKISASKSELVEAFKRLDTERDGIISVNQWRTVMKSVLKMDLPWLLLRPHLAYLSSPGKIWYMTTFDHVTIMFHKGADASVTELIYKNKDDLEAAFRVIDRKRVGYVTHAEFKECCFAVCQALGRKELTDDEANKIAAMADLNSDGKIDYNEFFEAFRIVDLRVAREAS